MTMKYFVLALALAWISPSWANFVPEKQEKLKYYLVHNGAVSTKCPDGSYDCLHEAMGTLEVRFHPNQGVSAKDAWNAVRMAYGGQFYSALEDSVCSRELEIAKIFAEDVRRELRA